MCLFCFIAIPLIGQDEIKEDVRENNIEVKLLAFPTGDSIMVRWAPLDLYAWHYANENGYTLKRETIRVGNKVLSDAERESSLINLGEFKPLDSLAWQQSINMDDKWESLAAGSLYGDFNTVEPGVLPGSLTDIENQSIATNNKFTFHFIASAHSMNAAKKLGEVFVDYDVKKGDAYLYRIFFNPNGDKFFNLINDSYLVADNTLEQLSYLDSLVIGCGDSTATVKWNTFNSHHQYMSYDVYKSDSRLGKFNLINEAPVVSGKNDDFEVSYSDSLTNNVDSVYYKVQGRTPFGFVGPMTKVIAGKGIADYKIYRSIIRISEETEPGEVIIGWESNPKKDQYLKGFNIHIANTYGEATYLANDEIIPPTQRQYLIKNAPRSSYISVETITLRDESHMSVSRLVSLNDQEAPTKPEGLVCLLDTIKNVVDLEWEWGEEVDIDGYHVMASWTDNNDFHMISDTIIRTNTFSFPVNAKRNGEDFYFSLRATDFRMNDSEFSDACKVTFLDVQPPTKALIRTFHEGQDKIGFEWARSASHDVEKHVFYRKSPREQRWMQVGIDTMNQGIALFQDSMDLKNNIIYSYKIVAEDNGGNRTDSEIKRGKIWDDKLSEKILHFSLADASDKTSNKCHLSWKYFPPQLLEKLTIYKATPSGDWVTHRVLKEKELFEMTKNISTGLNQYDYVDTFVEKDKPYKYKLKARLKNGSSSPMSKIKQIQL